MSINAPSATRSIKVITVSWRMCVLRLTKSLENRAYTEDILGYPDENQQMDPERKLLQEAK